MFLTTFIVFVGLLINYSHSSYLELNDHFSEVRKDGGNWLIKFYAPWCGHCQKLEPVWTEVGNALSNTNIRVGRIDCSHFPNIAAEFGIRGYPTIKFITPDNEFTFTGDRNTDDIVQFATRVYGPPVQVINTSQDLALLKDKFFMYAGELKGDLWDAFYDSSKKFRVHAHFHVVNQNVAKDMGFISEFPSVFVYKENRPEFFRVDESHHGDFEELKASMSKWINKERFDTFQKVTHGNINELFQLHRYIVLVVVDEKKLIRCRHMSEFRGMVEEFAKSNKMKFEKRFIFGWIGSPELANSIVLKVLPLPFFLVLNSTNHYYHVPDLDYSTMTGKDLETFLEKVQDQSVPAYGGNGFIIRLYRPFFELKTAIVEMWQGNPVLTSVLFTIPILFLSFIFYSLCFADILDTEDEEELDEEDDDEDPHLKKE